LYSDVITNTMIDVLASVIIIKNGGIRVLSYESQYYILLQF